MSGFILAGDLGGTKTLLALADTAGGRPQIVREQRFDSQSYPAFDQMLSEFLAGAGNPAVESACFGLAGPTDGISAQLTYLPWHIEAPRLSSAFAIPQVVLANDFYAAANGLALLEDEHLQTLQGGTPKPQWPRLLIGAGTGLGVAGLVWRDGRYTAVPGEGGHVGFAPQSPQQGNLWQWMAARSGRVTIEDVLCGAGIARIHAFLGGEERTPAEVSEAAIAGRDPRATQAIELWLSIYGAFAGDMALAWLSYGGVYIAGGVSAKVMPNVRSAPFLAAFRDKREHRRITEAMPVHLVLEERLGLLGALALAHAASGR